MAKGELPRPRNTIRLSGVVAILLAHFLALLFVMITFSKTVPTYSILFEQEDIALPVVTQRIVMLSEICVLFPFFLFFMGVCADAAIVLTLAYAARNARLLSAYSNSCLLAAGAVLFYVSAWLCHPVFSLVHPG